MRFSPQSPGLLALSLTLAPAHSLAALLYATHFSGTLNVLSFTTPPANSTGSSSLTVLSSARNCGRLPSWATYDPVAEVLYCLDEFNWGGAMYAFNASADGTLTATTHVGVLGNAVFSSLYQGDGGKTYQALAHYQTSQVSTFALPLTSSSQALQSFVYTMSGSGPNPGRQERPHPHMTAVDPTGSFIVVPDLGADLLRVYSIDKATGLLTSCANVAATPGVGPRHAGFWVSPSEGGGTMMYVANELGNSVSVYSVGYPTEGTQGGCLSLYLIQTKPTFPSGQAVKSNQKVGEVQVMGNSVTISNRGDASFGTANDSLAVFPLDASGAIGAATFSPAHGDYPRTMRINKAGTFVAIGNQNSATVVIVSRDPATGEIGDEVASVVVGPTGTGGSDGLSSVCWAD